MEFVILQLNKLIVLATELSTGLASIFLLKIYAIYNLLYGLKLETGILKNLTPID